METLASRPVQHFVERVVVELATLALLALLENFGLVARKHAVEPPQYSHGEHDALVLWWPVGTA